MAQTLITLHAPFAFVIKSTTDTSFVLLTANFAAETVASSILSAGAVALLQTRLQRIIAELPSKADVEAGFAGLVASLFAQYQFEQASTQTNAYSGGVATITLANLANPGHVAVWMPHSISAPFSGNT